MILLPNKTVDPKYNWMRGLHVPVRIINGIMDISQIVYAVGGSKPLIVGDTVYGRVMGKPGYISFYTTTENMYDQILKHPDSYYYWSRERPSKGYVNPPMPSFNIRGRTSPDEPWHSWSETKIANKIVAICEDSVKSKDPIDIICLVNDLSHWGFIELFQSRYPEHYYEYTKHKKIPTTDSLAAELSKRFPYMSCTTE